MRNVSVQLLTDDRQRIPLFHNVDSVASVIFSGAGSVAPFRGSRGRSASARLCRRLLRGSPSGICGCGFSGLHVFSSLCLSRSRVFGLGLSVCLFLAAHLSGCFVLSPGLSICPALSSRLPRFLCLASRVRLAFRPRRIFSGGRITHRGYLTVRLLNLSVI